jgi:crotonobetainyl-CoA:carnitine CoA-transferase CaiB-like acyl-CoA transferase
MYDLLRGIRVVEVAGWTFVPSGGAVLADWGADVVKVEHPVTGDPQRGLFVSELGEDAPDIMIEQPNRGKRSVTLDLASDAGHAVLDKLLATADVFLTNALPPVRQKLRIDLDDVRAVKPDIVYARGSGYGPHGPDARKGGFDVASAWARAGMGMEVTAHRPGGPFGEPVWQPPAFVDLMGGLTTAGAIAAALVDRERTGRARVVDVSLLATASWAVSPAILAGEYRADAAVLPKVDRTERPNPVVNLFRTKDDRWLVLSLLQSDRYWAELCEVIDRPQLATDVRFVDSARRAENRQACTHELDSAFAQRTLDEWRERLDGFSGVWSPFQLPGELHADPQVAANGILQTVDDGGSGFRVVASPAQYDGVPPGQASPAPGFGQHTEEVLLELGLTWDDIIELKLTEVIA